MISGARQRLTGHRRGASDLGHDGGEAAGEGALEEGQGGAGEGEGDGWGHVRHHVDDHVREVVKHKELGGREQEVPRQQREVPGPQPARSCNGGGGAVPGGRATGRTVVGWGLGRGCGGDRTAVGSPPVQGIAS